MFLYGSTAPKNPTFAESFAAGAERDDAAERLWNTTRDLQLYRDNTDGEANARAEAYERRNKAIFDASGVQLPNPYREQDHAERLRQAAMAEQRRMANLGGEPDDPAAMLHAAEADWKRRATDLARERPEFAKIIAADRDIGEDAYAITREAGAAYDQAAADADRAGLGTARRLGNVLGGGIAGMLRDPLQVGTLFVGGGVSAPAKSVFGRVLQTVLTEAAINGGVEAGVQLAAQDYKRRAGVEHGLGDALQQVGLAAAFGGTFGGLVAGGREIFRLTGKAAPEGVLERIEAGEAQPGDTKLIADALGVEIDPGMVRAADLAAAQTELDRVAFGPPPAGVDPVAAERAAAEALRQAERGASIDGIVRSEFPLGAAPKRPVTLMQFLTTRAVGGLKDDAGALAAMGLSRHFVPGGGALVRKNGKTLDMAREAAAEAGYFDQIYGDPARATAESTPDDLLRALRAEAAGEPSYSPRLDGDRVSQWQDFETRRREQDAYRRIVEDVAGIGDELGLSLDEDVLRRASRFVDDETDAATALERAIDEDYRLNAEAETELGGSPYDDSDIPFFDDWQDPGAGARAGAAAGAARGDDAGGQRGAFPEDGGRLQGAGGDERTGVPAQPLRAAGDTPEPGTAEAVEISELVLTEATPAGEQTLLGGVAPVSTREKLEAEGAKPLRGGDAAMPEGGLFDLDAHKQLDIWDAMPGATTADGRTLHATHATMIDDADRTEFFSDLIASCKD